MTILKFITCPSRMDEKLREFVDKVFPSMGLLGGIQTPNPFAIIPIIITKNPEDVKTISPFPMVEATYEELLEEAKSYTLKQEE